MNAERLLAHYEHIADAPDAIARLRRFILDLAVRGKLVPQLPNDQPIESKLLLRELDRKQPTGRTGADLGPVTLEEVPVDIPKSWNWSRLFQLCVQDAPIVYGILQPGPDIRPEGVPYVRPSEIENGQIALSDIRHTTREIAGQYSRASIQSGDLIFTIVGTIGAVAIVPDELDGGNITQSSCRLRVDPRLIERDFLLQALRSNCVIDQIDRMKLGTAVPRLNIAHVRAIAIPLPPLAEQHRIVAKVDKLMALCDRLEAARASREALRHRLVAASLARLNAPDPETFQADAHFVVDALPELTARAEQIKPLRQTILNLAVRGKLVPQDPNDEPAWQLLKRIAAEKARLDRKERTKRELNNLNANAEPMQIPKGWALAPLADLVTVLNGRAYKQNELLSAGTPVLRVGNLFTSDKWYYSTLQLDEDKYCEKGDLIFAWSASFGPFIWDGEKAIYHYHIWKLPLHSESDLNKLYLYNFLLHKTREIKEAGHGISMIHMTKEKMEKLVVPLPPLAEQHRIVAKVDALMALCDRLEASLTAAAAARRRLLYALLAEALAPVDAAKLEEVA
jgi:type I restriction enzyme S subunit